MKSCSLKQLTYCLTVVCLAMLYVTCDRAPSELFAQSDDFENAPIHYSRSESHDAVAALKQRLDSGNVDWKWDAGFGWLPSLLDALEIPVESQVLVFSKTSLQVHQISPSNPRALYFNDSVYVGYVPGSGLLEMAANDVELGAVFYTLDSQLPEQPTIREESSIDSIAATLSTATSRQPHFGNGSPLPKLLRDKGQCLACHATSRTSNVPGYLIRSIYSDASGRAYPGTSTFVTDDRSPFEQRWGGWYVTGTHGSMRHMGNQVSRNADDPESMPLDFGANREELPKIVDTRKYLSPHSDIAALMVLEHQARVHNLITRASFEARSAIYQDESISKLIDREDGFRSETTLRRIDRAATDLLEAMLFAEEYPLGSTVVGTSDFVNLFSKRSPKSRSGKSLYQLDLNYRLLRYPLSFLIYTPEFAELPEPILTIFRDKLNRLLRGETLADCDVVLADSLRADILEILRETKPDLILD